MHFFLKTGLTLALLTGAAFTTPPAALAQSLALGQNGSTTLSGTGTLTDNGTTASGTFSYSAGSTGLTLANQNKYTEWNIYGPSTANIKGGSIGTLGTHNTSIANVSGGTITNNLVALNASTLNVSGGSIGFLYTHNTSVANINGGTITGNLIAVDNSALNVSGGIFDHIYTYGAGTLDLFGTDLIETFQADNGSSTRYALAGTLSNGDALNAIYYNSGGTLEFNGVPAVAGGPPSNPVPEASTTVSFGLLLALGLGGVVIAAKRKKTSATQS